MSDDLSYPHLCPRCGARFGWGADAGLLAVVASAPFDEPAPCCGERISGRIENGEMILDTTGADNE